MEFIVDLKTIESYILDDYSDDYSNEKIIVNINLRRNSLLLAIAERLERITELLEKR